MKHMRVIEDVATTTMMRELAVLTRRQAKLALFAAAMLGVVAQVAAQAPAPEIRPGTPPVETQVTPPGVTAPAAPASEGATQPAVPAQDIETTVTPRRSDPVGPAPQPIGPPLPPVLLPPKVTGSAPLSTEVPAPPEPAAITVQPVPDMGTDVPSPEPPAPIVVEPPGSP